MSEGLKKTSERVRVSFCLEPIDDNDRGSEKFPFAVAGEFLTGSERYVVRNTDGSRTFASLLVGEQPNNTFGKVLDIVGEDIVGTTSFTLDTEGTPTILSTRTESGLRKTGLAKRRIQLIDQICRERLGKGVQSSQVRSPDGDKFWEHLVSEGVAQEIVLPEGKKRYSLL
ncbi:MAG: hypothetical protein HYS26_04395 [Candidatus Kaiserbacteria bacterium]|nr:MAG: hypothetical protein HYS26_04395 [Candidatus Kaiserbacteria bacterium]